jgi:hypothetical protein
MKRMALALLITATLHGSAQQQARFPVTRQQVAHALLRHGLTVADDQVSLVASIVASNPEPELDVDLVQPLGASVGDPRIRAKVRLVCPQPRACVPFYAIVTWPLDTVLSPLPVLAHAAAVHAPVAPIAMRAGSNAMLIVDTAQMHIRVPVISLQDGSVGSRIHVTSPDRKQNYTATIVSPTLLTGSL